MHRLLPLFLCIVLAVFAARPVVAQGEPPRDPRGDLLLAIEMNDLDAAEAAIEAGAANQISIGDPSPLATAAQLNQLRMLALLLRSGGDPNGPGASALELAVRNDSVPMVRMLLAAGAEVPGSTPEAELLDFAQRGENAPVIYEDLLEAGADPQVGLEVAIDVRKRELVELCLARGTDVSLLPPERNLLGVYEPGDVPGLLDRTITEQNRDAALRYYLGAAVETGDGGLVELILDRGASPRFEHLLLADAAGQDDLILTLEPRLGADLGELAERAEAAERAELASFLRQVRRQRLMKRFGPVILGLAIVLAALLVVVVVRHGRQPSPRKLHDAILRGNVEGVRDELEKGTDPRQPYRGHLPLHLAVAGGEIKIVRLLLRHAEVEDLAIRDEAGLAPLHHAAASGNVALVELLLRHGGAVDVRSESGRTPLYVAVRSGHGELMKLFLERGADLHAMTDDGTLLLTAIGDRDRLAVKRLLEAGAEPTADAGRSPRHAAVGIGDQGLVRELVRRGARLDATDHAGRTPFGLARFLKRPELVKLLQELGAKA